MLTPEGRKVRPEKEEVVCCPRCSGRTIETITAGWCRADDTVECKSCQWVGLGKELKNSPKAEPYRTKVKK